MTNPTPAVEALLAEWDNHVIDMIDDYGRQFTRSGRVFDLIAELRTLLRQPEAVPEGMVLVPIEPTYEMVQAGAKLVKENLPFHTGTLAIYKAMLNARPERTNG